MMKMITLNPNPNSQAKLVGYLHEESPEMPGRNPRPCVVICPGGGYEFLSDREADPPAFAFLERGYNVFILDYSLSEQAQNMQPLIEASLSLILIRENCEEWNIRADQIAILGFSAGGHVAASLGTLWDNGQLKQKIDTKGGKNRPDAQILCYPVITAGEFAHRSSINQLTGGKEDEESCRIFSLENQVDGKTPPAFLWHTADDDCVPPENTLMFAAALQRNHIPFECHIYPTGGHGQSMCNAEVGVNNPHCATWFKLCAQWLDELFDFHY